MSDAVLSAEWSTELQAVKGSLKSVCGVPSGRLRQKALEKNQPTLQLLEQSSGLSNLTNGCTPQPTGLQIQSISFTQTNIHSFNIHLAQRTVLNDEDTPDNETHKKLYSQSIY